MRDITSANKAAATHAAQHAKGGADPITPERIGAAPGGYGIGETPKYIADANDAVKNGRYAVDKSTLNLPGPIGDLWHYTYLDVYTGNRPDVYIKQTMTSPYQGWHQCEITRCFYDARGGWQPWEWVNPPMILGTEYRTTERYMDKPVYTKVLDCGNLPDGTTKEVAHGITNVDIVVGAQAIASNSTTGFNGHVYLPDIYNGSLTDRWTTYLAGVNAQNIRMFCGGGLVGCPVYVTLKYTKTTD